MPNRPTHYLRMGTHAEKDYLQRGRPLYDKLIFNANLVEATTAAIAIHIATVGKPYLVDPSTYAFALEPSLITSPRRGPQIKLKRTFASLAAAYRLPIPQSELGTRPLRPVDLASAALADFTTAVIEYQRSRLQAALVENAVFIEGDAAGEHDASLLPDLLFAPYFVDDFTGTWNQVNLDALAIGAEIAGTKAAAILAWTSHVARPDQLMQLARAYADSEIRTVFLWPTDLDEHRAAVPALEDYAETVRIISEKKTVHASYGGFFAILLSYRGLSGVSHGVGYGDKRDLEPVGGGGLPPARYYLRAVRDGVSLGSLPIIVAGLTQSEFLRRVCDCAICVGLLQAGGVRGLVQELTATELRTTPNRGLIEVATPRVYQLTRFHFLLNRHREFDEVQRLGFPEIASGMREDAAWIAGRLGPQVVRHIEGWLEVANPGRSLP